MQVFQVGYDVKVNCAENTLFIAVRRSIGTSGSNAKNATCSTFNLRNKSGIVFGVQCARTAYKIARLHTCTWAAKTMKLALLLAVNSDAFDLVR